MIGKVILAAGLLHTVASVYYMDHNIFGYAVGNMAVGLALITLVFYASTRKRRK